MEKNPSRRIPEARPCRIPNELMEKRMKNGKIGKKASAAFLPGALLTVILAGSGPLSRDTDGKQIFLDKKCDLCHAVTSAQIEAKTKLESMLGPDLAGVGSRHEAEWIGEYMNQDVQLNDVQHVTKFKGSAEELAALVDWLLEQKSTTGPPPCGF